MAMTRRTGKPTPFRYERYGTERLRKGRRPLVGFPAYAERMAYRWMEASRYGDTNGYQSDGARDMWRWRD